MWHGNAWAIQQAGFVCLLLQRHFLDNHMLRVCPSVKFSVTFYYIMSRHLSWHWKSGMPHREGETLGSGLRMHLFLPHPSWVLGEQCADMLWGRQEGSVHFGVNAVLGETVAKVVWNDNLKTQTTPLLILCTHWKSLFISTLSWGRNFFQLVQFHCKLIKNRLDA